MRLSQATFSKCSRTGPFPRRRSFLSSGLAALFAGGSFLFIFTGPASAAETEETQLSYNRDIRPILSDKCFKCHGPDPNTREADLRLDVRASAIAAKGFVPGDADASELVIRIFHEDPDEVMPPTDENRKLTDKERALLKRWVAEGAEYEAHWSYITVTRPAVPPLDPKAATWAVNEIDAFVARKLAKNGLALSPEADRRTLARRVSLDLTGLPPTPEQVTAFVNDTREDAYEKYVDSLLESPHYGERMAVPWLDAVRYADTVGYHGDQEREASPFRDYVIRSFNENKPFDQFTIEQLAGDLLPNATLWQRVAASYNRLNQISAEGGIQDKEYLAKYQSERVRAASTAWLGSTMACCECHDHKFDPFSMADFYSFAAFFADILEKGAWNNEGAYQVDTTPFEAPGIRFERFGPELEVPNDEQAARLETLEGELTVQQKALSETTPKLKEGALRWAAEQRAAIADHLPRDFVYLEDRGEDREISAKDATFISRKEGPVYQGSVARKQNGKETVQHIVNTAKQPLELSQGDELFAYVYLDPKNPPKQIMLQFHRDSDRWDHRAWWGEDRISFGGIGQDTVAHRRKGPLPETGKWVRLSVSLEDVGLQPGDKLTNLAYTQFDGLAYWDSAGIRTSNPVYRWADVPTPVLSALKKPDGQLSEAERAALLEHYRALAPELQPARDKIARIEGEIGKIRSSLRVVPATFSAEPRQIRVLPRGNWMDDSGQIVTPQAPHFLPQIATPDKATKGRLSRLDLAQWIASRENPLTARTFANRLWAQYFGAGISKVLNDLGSQGEWPTHPDLLDWLAAEFMESGWDVKHLAKTIVMSATYRQSSQSSPELDERDPYNRLLAHQSQVRLPAEFIRDQALSVSGLLNPAIGGPSVHPYQPAGYYEHLNFPKREYEPDLNENQYRRGLYTHWQRTFLHPMLMAFDAPARDECTMDRPVSNTPLQALVLLNDPTFVEAARALAQEMVDTIPVNGTGDGETARIATAFERALARPPQPAELDALRALYLSQKQTYAKAPEAAEGLIKVGIDPVDEAAAKDPAELAALTAVTRAILNLHETVTRY